MMHRHCLIRLLAGAVACLAAHPALAAAQSGGLLDALPVLRTPVGRWELGTVLGARGVSVRVRRRSRAPERTTSDRTTGGRAATARAGAVLTTADRYLGTPYVWGGTTPRGFDCSGFVQYVFRKHRVSLPRVSRDQATAGTKVRGGVKKLRAGDLMFFASRGRRVDHVAIYTGNGRFIHSSSSGGGVRYDRLATRRGRWFASHLVASRRVMADGRSLVRDLDRSLALARTLAPLDPPDAAPPP